MTKLLKTAAFLLALIVSLAGLTGCRRYQSRPIILGFAQPQTMEHPQGQMVERIRERVAELTNGAVVIRHFPSDQLGSQADVFRQTVEGINAIVIGDFASVQPYFADVAVFNLPYMFTSPEHMLNVLNSPLAQEMFDGITQASGLIPLGSLYFGTRVLTTRNVIATRPEDLRGVRIRSPQGTVMVDAVNSLGSTAVPMPLAELYMALQTGTVEGQENPLQTIISNRFYEVQNNVILTNHMIGLSIVFANQRIWNSIPDIYRTEIERIIYEECLRTSNEIAANETILRGELEARGMRFITPDFDAFRTHSLNETLRRYSQFSDLIARIVAIN